MSRRYRLEQEYLRQLKQEDEEDNQGQQLLKYTDPIVWARLNNGFNIMDVIERDHEEVCNMIQKYYIPKDVLCRNSEIDEDPVSLKSMMDHIAYTLRDGTSIKAVKIEDDGSETLAGALLLRVSRQSEFDRVFSRTILQDGEARKKCLSIQTAISRRTDIFKLYNCDVFMRVYLLCVKDEFRKLGLGYQLMRVALDVVRSLDIKIASGIFNSVTLQRCAKRLGYKLILEVSYTNWRDKNNELIFSDPGPGNYTCALMINEVPAEGISDPNVVHKLSPFEQRVVIEPKTRAEKRAQMNKLI